MGQFESNIEEPAFPAEDGDSYYYGMTKLEYTTLKLTAAFIARGMCADESVGFAIDAALHMFTKLKETDVKVQDESIPLSAKQILSGL